MKLANPDVGTVCIMQKQHETYSFRSFFMLLLFRQTYIYYKKPCDLSAFRIPVDIASLSFLV